MSTNISKGTRKLEANFDLIAISVLLLLHWSRESICHSMWFNMKNSFWWQLT